MLEELLMGVSRGCLVVTGCSCLLPSSVLEVIAGSV